MSDFDAKIIAIDSAMDATELYLREMSDLRAHIAFDMRSLFDKLHQEIVRVREQIEIISDQIDAFQSSVESATSEDKPDSVSELDTLYSELWSKQGILHDLEQIMTCCSDHGTELMNQLHNIHSLCDASAGDAHRFMGKYIHDLNLICNQEATNFGTYRSDSGYYVCVIDSSLYPSTAEHIRVAQNVGQPARVTVDRSGASQRREESLHSIPARREFDRDEYPMALFSEGGAGADVAYLEGPDNRGAGSYISWQLRRIPDGAEVRIRVI